MTISSVHRTSPLPKTVLAARRIRLEQKQFWRSSQNASFTFLLPVILLVVLSLRAGGGRVPGTHERVAVLLVPGILAFGLVAVNYSNIAVVLVYQRAHGILKRYRLTPLPPSVFLAGVIGSALVSTLAMTGLCVVISWTFFDVQLPIVNIVPFAVMILLGAGAFAALGVALTAVVRSAEAAVPVVNAIFIPLAIVSGVFSPTIAGPQWLTTVTGFLPIRRLNDGIQACFTTQGLAFRPIDLLVLAAWGVAGVLLAVRYFVWVPKEMT